MEMALPDRARIRSNTAAVSSLSAISLRTALSARIGCSRMVSPLRNSTSGRAEATMGVMAFMVGNSGERGFGSMCAIYYVNTA